MFKRRLNYILKILQSIPQLNNEHYWEDLCVLDYEIDKHALQITIN